MVPDLWQPDYEVEQIVGGIFEDLDKVREYLQSLFEGRVGE